MAPETHPGQFGPRVIGEEEFEAEQQLVEEEQRTTFGDRVVDGSNMEVEAEAPDSAEPEEDEDDIPDGYEIEFSGAYGEIFDPDGEQVTLDADTESGKYHGRDAAVKAAWAHAEQVEAERQAEADAEAEEEPETPQGFETADEISDATVEEAEAALEANPELVDEFMRAEMVRPDGVRKGVLDALEEAEQARDTTRDEVLETIESLRAELQVDGE